MPGLREAAQEADRGSAREPQRPGSNTRSLELGLRQPLLTTIQTEVIPRLMLAHGLVAALEDGGSTAETGRSDIEAFVRLAVTGSDAAGLAFTAELEARGVRTEDLFLDLLAPSARLLGEYWETDRCTFTEVTVGVARLQRIMHDLASRLDFDVDPTQHSMTAMILPAPGEQHTFGITMVAEFFRRAGWSISDVLPRDEAEILEAIEARPVSLIGFSLSSEVLIDRLASVIGSLRSMSSKSDVSVLVGGPVFVDHPDWVERVGADAMALDGREGVVQAQRLVRSAGLSF